jgi:hypothetical protein
MTTKMSIKPVISASKVAGLIGLHKFQDAHEIMYDLLCRDPVLKDKIAGLELRLHRKPFHKVKNEVLNDTNVAACVSAGLRSCSRTDDVKGVLKEVENAVTTLLHLRYPHYTPDVREQLVCEIRGKVSKQRGINNEAKILDTYEVSHDVKVTERNTKMLRKEYATYVLTGRTDGWVASENRIVDSKERTRFFADVPLYDEIQLRVYMEMMGCPESELIERFPDGTMRVTKFTNDPEKWAAIQKSLESAIETLTKASQNEEELKRIIFANSVEFHGSQTTLNFAPKLDI